MRHVSRVAVFALVFVALMTWALQRSFSAKDGYGGRADAIIDGLKLADNRLLKDVLLTRAGLLQNYDPLVVDIDDLRARSEAIAALAGPSDAGSWRDEIDAVRKVVARKEDALERFKSQNALLQNSLAYFDTLSEKIVESDTDPASKLAVAGLGDAITHLFRDASADNVSSVESRLQALTRTPIGTSADAGIMRKHVELIVDAIPRTNEALLALQDDTITRATKSITDDIARERAATRRSWLLTDAGLYAGAFLFFLLLMRTLALLHKDSEALQHALLKQRLAFETSSLFIACPPEQVEERMQEMLRRLGEGYGVWRAYLLKLDGSRRVIKWEAEPEHPGWPAALFDFADEIAALPVEALRLPYDDVPVSQGLRAALAEHDVKFWVCVKVQMLGEVTALLAFDRYDPVPLSSREDHGNLLLHASVVHNALMRLHMYRKRTELETKLRKAERLKAIGTFTTGVAHNFNNLVGAIAGQAEMTMDLLPPDHRAAGHMRRLMQTTTRAQEVASQILDFGRVGGGVRSEVAVGPLIAETVAVLGAGPGSGSDGGVTVAFEPSDIEGKTWADAGRLQQVFHNILLNAVQASAVQASPEPATITISIDECLTAERITAGGRLAGGLYLRVVVRDQGSGIDAATLARMFEPFFTTRPTGTGLGLATVMETLNELEGGIDVESRPGDGTTVTIWLPSAKKAPALFGAPALTGHTIMLVNPDPEGVLRDEEVVASLGFEPVGFVELANALEALRHDAARFDLVIVERQTSAKAMQTYVTNVRESLKAGAHIVLSGAFSASEAQDLEKLEAFACIARPWSPSVLRSVVHDALRTTSVEQMQVS